MLLKLRKGRREKFKRGGAGRKGKRDMPRFLTCGGTPISKGKEGSSNSKKIKIRAGQG